ncbi:MAG TPA: LCP family protein [Fervidobacterium sp.]|nr:LytR family transcriptional regulator [Fervidobacterium sp.]HOK87794.1 LCP family protein [Fervidobacterium sp.]HOM74128.1 LCP family protein [Fervidobacterium sp.]HPP17779.1 LCP family protein [Fervidobacterium sp.]HRD20043.1 LCP family protein [Fervidobacterium sp.]
MKNVLYIFVIIIGIAAALVVSVLWVDFFLRIFIVPTENPVNVLVLGLDKDISGTRRTDVILVASLDLKTKKMMMSSIPRDLIVDGKKINAFYQTEGIEEFKKRIENLTGLDIKRYVIVDYDIFKFLGDELGPIEVFVDRPMHYVDSAQNLEIDFSPGYYKMKGKELLAYLRFRKTAEGDIGRLDKQRVIIEKLAQKALSKNVFSLTELYKEIRQRTEFNIEIGEIVYIFSKIKTDFSIESVSFPFYIGQDGNLYIEESKMDAYKDSFATRSKKIEEKYRYYVINNSENRSYAMVSRIEEVFKSNGYSPNKIFYEGVDVDFKKNTALILRKNDDLKTYVEQMISKIGTVTPWDILFVEDRLDYITKYLAVIGELTKTGRQVIFPIDFIIILKEDLI